MSQFLNLILLSAIISFSLNVHAESQSESCNQDSFDLTQVFPGETRTQISQSLAKNLTARYIEEIQEHALKESGTQKQCGANSDHCFGNAGSTRYSIARIRDPFHPAFASSGTKIEPKALFDQETAYPYGVYEVTKCVWDYPGQADSCKTTCTLIAEPSPGS